MDGNVNLKVPEKLELQLDKLFIITKAKIYIIRHLIFIVLLADEMFYCIQGLASLVISSFNMIRSILLCVHVLFCHVSLCLSLKEGKNDPVLHVRVLQLTDKTWVLTRISHPLLNYQSTSEVTCRRQVLHCSL